MIRCITGMSLALCVVGLSIAQEPGKQSKDKPGDPPAAKPKDAPNAEMIVNSILQRMDKNKDGKISRSEAEGRIAENFDRIDTNKDGFLDRAELMAMAKMMAARQGPGGRPPMFGGPGGMRPDPLDFDALDKNADGRLTREELKGTRFAELFDAIDTNKDGKIDPKEWAAYHAKSK
jgi:Ca2+-binding EF-hand superfamily protein